MRLMRIVIVSIITLPFLLFTTCLLDLELPIPEYSLTITSPPIINIKNIAIQCSFTADEDVHKCRYTLAKSDGTYTEEHEEDLPAGQINQLNFTKLKDGEYNFDFAVLTYRNGNYEILSFLVKEISFWVDTSVPEAPTVDIAGGQHTDPKSVTISFTVATPPDETPVRLDYYILNKSTNGIWNYSNSLTTPITPINITEDTVLRARVIDQAFNSSAIIKEIYYIGTTPGADLLARWTLDNLDSGVWPEDGGNVPPYDGANRNATEDIDGVRGNVASFDSDLLADIVIAHDPAFDLDEDPGYTICGWYWMDSALINPDPITIFSKMDITGANKNWWIYADSSGFLTWTRTNAGADSSLNYAVDHRDSSWHHFAAVSTAATHILYIDGVQRAISTTTATTETPAGDLYIGSRIDAAVNTDYWDGKLDDLRIYNRGLSPVEIYEISNSSW